MGWDFIVKVAFLLIVTSATAISLIWYFIFRTVEGAKERLTLDAEAARAQVDRIAKEVLTNTVIEEYTFTIEA